MNKRMVKLITLNLLGIALIVVGGMMYARTINGPGKAVAPSLSQKLDAAMNSNASRSDLAALAQTTAAQTAPDTAGELTRGYQMMARGGEMVIEGEKMIRTATEATDETLSQSMRVVGRHMIDEGGQIVTLGHDAMKAAMNMMSEPNGTTVTP